MLEILEQNEHVVPMTGGINLHLHIDAVIARLTTNGEPYAQLSLQRSLWPADSSDIARNCDLDKQGGDGAVCSICLEPIQVAGCQEHAVVTACGHVFHTQCCSQSEYVSVNSRGCFNCPTCREHVTEVSCSYEGICIDSQPMPKTMGTDLGQILSGSSPLQEVLQKCMYRDFVLGSFCSCATPPVQQLCEHMQTSACAHGKVPGASKLLSFSNEEGKRKRSEGWLTAEIHAKLDIKLVMSKREHQTDIQRCERRHGSVLGAEPGRESGTHPSSLSSKCSDKSAVLQLID